MNIPRGLCPFVLPCQIACMTLHCTTCGVLPDTPEYTLLTSSLQAVEGVLFVLMLVRLTGQIILGLWPEIFEEI